MSPAIGVEEDYHLFLGWRDSKGHCFQCGKETNFKLFDGYFRFIHWCCPDCYDEKFGPKKRRKV